ncbi:GNAT family N-acetyltransferase [Lichenihabitans psoromatis]|uniref:GNAT family N-acetyltransferase n=1 Tax=Lichenihabitans psoromatis TaxID=2528642 RepID=UPI0010361E41|nr:GNAT family protein [Lichenihabitans psoromatis]
MEDQLLLRAFRYDDIASLLTWFPTAEDLAQWGSPARTFPLDEAQIIAFLKETEGDEPKRRMWAGEVNGAFVATATTIIDWHQGVVLLGFIGISPAERGRGLAHPFLQKVIDTTFVDERIERIELNVYTFNEPAIRTYEKLGFLREGVRRSLARLGTVRWDAAHYALLRSDPPPLQ